MKEYCGNCKHKKVAKVLEQILMMILIGVGVIKKNKNNFTIQK